MSDARTRILSRVKAALGELPTRQSRPDIVMTVASAQSKRELGDWDLFAERFQAVHGQVLSDGHELGAWIRREGWRLGYCAPALVERVRPCLPESVQIETVFDRAKVDEYAFSITEAEGAIAETGTLIITDRGTPNRLSALAPWVHIVLLEPARVRRTVSEALQSMPDDNNIVWITGPSKTADVEGILIEGVHGPGVQAVVRWPY